MKNKPFMRSSFCFTLVELLIVIAIIAILAMLFLPALSKSRDKAKAIICMSNIKQCGQLLNHYADDSKDLFPSSINTIGGSLYTWASSLYKNGYVNTPIIGRPSIFVCPAYGPKVWQNDNQMYGMWIGDAQHGVLSTYTASGDRYLLARHKIENSRTYFADSTRAEYQEAVEQSLMLTNGTGAFSDSNSARVIHLRHSRLGNCLYADGHVSPKDSNWISRDARYNWKY
jgi:prepilin-type processing-associated H-X9-DG protein/prepilin-type N-terminal cleavage/methylation domain-containing protein